MCVVFRVMQRMDHVAVVSCHQVIVGWEKVVHRAHPYCSVTAA
jgi:hypothetical protein